MGDYLDLMRARVRQLLYDEFDPAKTMQWQDDTLDVIIGEIVREISKAKPYEVTETVTLTLAGKNEISIASIANLISIPYGEYPVDKDPRRYRNVKVWGSTAIFTMNVRPSGDESAYLYCYKLHTITESSSTLTPDLEDICVLGVAAQAARSKSRTQVNKVNVGGGRVASGSLTWAEVTQAKYKSALAGQTKQRVRLMYSED